jgi:hypothetical protein
VDRNQKYDFNDFYIIYYIVLHTHTSLCEGPAFCYSKMDRRYNTGSYGSYGSDANFSDILNRTRQNISRISSRYSTDALDQSSYSQPRPSAYRDSFENDKYGTSSNQRSMISYSRSAENESVENRPPPVPARSEKSVTGLDEILDRLSRLEQENSGRLRMEERMLKLETSMANQVNSQNTTLEILQHDVDSRRR